jgi:hypothetical protein
VESFLFTSPFEHGSGKYVILGNYHLQTLNPKIPYKLQIFNIYHTPDHPLLLSSMSFNLIAVLILSSPTYESTLLETLTKFGQLFLKSEPGMLRYVIHKRLNSETRKTEIVVIER